MKVQVVHNINDIADIPQDKTQPIITRDGAKLVTVSIVGSSPVAAIMGTFAGIMNVIGGFEQGALTDKTVYMIPGGLATSLAEHRFSTVIGITGVTDLEGRLRSLSDNILAKPETAAPAPAEMPTEAMSAPGV